MKPLIGMLLTLCLVLTLAACGAPEAAPTEKPGEAPTQNTQNSEAPTSPTDAPTQPPSYTAQDWNLVADEDVTFTVTGFTANEHLGLEMHVYCENKSDKNMIFSLDGVSVCGVMYDPFWAEEVSAGKKVNSVLYFDTYQLETMGISSVDEISFLLRVLDSDNWMDEPFVEEDFDIYPTGLNEDTVRYPEYVHKNGETVLLDNDKLLFIVERVHDTDGDYYILDCYLHNRTDEDLLVGWDGVSVNGFMVDPYWAAAVEDGKQLYTQIRFSAADLAAQDIETVSQIEFTLYASDYDDFQGAYLVEETVTFTPN